MRRVGRFGGMVAGYVWDFAGERGLNWPLRFGIAEIGAQAPRPVGADDTALGALSSLFASAGFDGIATRTIDVSMDFQDFDDFWRAHTPNLHPVTKMIADLPNADRRRLIEQVRTQLTPGPNGSIAYSARANAVKARIPG